jgi:hypothetical protein
VATTNEFSSLQEFYQDRCLAIDVREAGAAAAYTCTVVDPLEDDPISSW